MADIIIFIEAIVHYYISEIKTAIINSTNLKQGKNFVSYFKILVNA